MNLFYLNRDPQLCAQQHCDKHVVKMIVEYAQLLSTAHRILDGVETPYRVVDKHGISRGKSILLLEGEDIRVVDNKPEILYPVGAYKASHVNHPVAIWCRSTPANYKFLYDLFLNLNYEYTLRYGKIHATLSACHFICRMPKNIPQGEFSDPPLSMPDEYKVDDAVTSYQNLYVGSKARFAKWTNRRPPDWFIQRTDNYVETHFERARAMA